MMTERAVDWAMRPKFFGVSSNSPIGLPSSSSSIAMTVTRPVFLSISMRAWEMAPGRLWYALSSASSMASTRVSRLTPFSFSTIRRAVISISIVSYFPVPKSTRERAFLMS